MKKTNVWSFQWADYELIWWTKWHEYFFMASVINKHQNDQWLQCHSVSCEWLLNIGLNTEVYLYDLKMCDDMSQTRYSDILIYPTYYHVTNLVGLKDSDCIYNVCVCVCVCVCTCMRALAHTHSINSTRHKLACPLWCNMTKLSISGTWQLSEKKIFKMKNM